MAEEETKKQRTAPTFVIVIEQEGDLAYFGNNNQIVTTVADAMVFNRLSSARKALALAGGAFSLLNKYISVMKLYIAEINMDSMFSIVGKKK